MATVEETAADLIAAIWMKTRDDALPIIVDVIRTAEEIGRSETAETFSVMLGALQAVVAYMEHTFSDPDRYHAEMMEPVRAAIAKALEK